MLCSLQLKIHKLLQTRHDYTQITVVKTGVGEIQQREEGTADYSYGHCCTFKQSVVKATKTFTWF